jgi:flavin-dependent dehydrogenase
LREKLPKPESAATFTLPIAAALSGETVANRTLLIGLAGGFVSACAEEVYPSCWSAVIAAKVAATALKQRHVQDALLEYRGEWGSTLGDYLRGPQQNLKLLLPLVYRNNIMSARVAEAILLGESVVR